MLKAYNYCFSHGMGYGGACGETRWKDVNEELLRAVGLDDVLLYACPPSSPQQQSIILDSTLYRRFDLNVSFLAYREHHVRDRSRRDHTLPWEFESDDSFHDNNDDEDDEDTDKVDPHFRRNDTTPYRVAIHIRRGDIALCRTKYADRYYPNTYYQQLIDTTIQQQQQSQQQQQQRRPYEVHIYSQSDDPENTGGQIQYETLDEFIERGYSVHLDESLPETWHGLIRADVTIVSISAFSMVPALLKFSHGTVMIPPGRVLRLHRPPLPNWATPPDTILQSSADALQALRQQFCVGYSTHIEKKKQRRKKQTLLIQECGDDIGCIFF